MHLSFPLCEGCGHFLLPYHAHVYFQWYGFQANNHIIMGLHRIYPSSKVSDNLQVFSSPTAKPCANMNTLGSILIIWCISSFTWIMFMRVKAIVPYYSRKKKLDLSFDRTYSFSWSYKNDKSIFSVSSGAQCSILCTWQCLYTFNWSFLL